MSSRATKAQTEKVIRAINRVYEADLARLIDWSDCGCGYAISVEGVDAIEVSFNGGVQSAVPVGGFMEPINSESLRVYK